jgi:hypothetical protein
VVLGIQRRCRVSASRDASLPPKRAAPSKTTVFDELKASN